MPLMAGRAISVTIDLRGHSIVRESEDLDMVDEFK